MTGPLADEQAREAIRHDLASTMFVEAGAGSGKTKSLIDRVLGIVMTDGVRLHDVAAVTFTEKAASELRDRLRVAFEEDKLAAMRSADEQRSCRAEVALDVNAILSGGRVVRGIVEGESVPSEFLPQLVELWRTGRFPVDRMMTYYDFDQIDQAAKDAEAGLVIKPVLRIG